MKLPDGPRIPPSLQMLCLIARPLEFLDTCANLYGDTFTLRVNKSRPVVYLSNPQTIEELFTVDPQIFGPPGGSGIVQPLLGNSSLPLLDGECRQRRRRLLMPPFHSERLQTYGQLICDITEQVMSQWIIGEPFLVRSSMQEITLRVILNIVFGLHDEQRSEHLRICLSSMLDYIASPLNSSLLYFRSLQKDLGPWSPWGRFLRQKQQIDQILYAEIKQRRVEMLHVTSLHPRTDILSLLLAARDEAGQPMTDVELRDELMTLLFSGHESTATALTWALYWISHQPNVRHKLLSELDTLDCDSNPSAIVQLPYLTAICQETLRIYPVNLVAGSRVLKSQMKLAGYQFEPGTVLVPCIYLTHQREDIYPEAKRFQPERFLKRQFSPYEYLPFGGSNRRCIGSVLAQFEIKLVVAKSVSRLKLVLTDSRPVKPVRRGFMLAPTEGMRMVVTGCQQREKSLVQV